MWSNDKPTAPGFYWCHQRGKARTVNVWCYKNGTELFTNEDSGASIKDEMYDGAQWMSVVEPPNPQDQNESAQPAPNVPYISDDMIEAIESRAEQSYRRHHSGIRGQQITPADALTWHVIHATREVLAAAAQAHHAPSIPDGWLRAIDEALVIAHIGVANAHDTYEQAKAKLDSLIGLHVDVATDPAVNGGYKLMPIEATPEAKP